MNKNTTPPLPERRAAPGPLAQQEINRLTIENARLTAALRVEQAGYLGARGEALEEAAAACDSRSDEHKYGTRWDSAKGAEAAACADAIRALAASALVRVRDAAPVGADAERVAFDAAYRELDPGANDGVANVAWASNVGRMWRLCRAALASRAPVEQQCQWPNCLGEQAQQELAASVHGELYSGAAPAIAQPAVVHATSLPELREHLKIASVYGEPITLSSEAATALYYAMTTGLPAEAAPAIAQPAPEPRQCPIETPYGLATCHACTEQADRAALASRAPAARNFCTVCGKRTPPVSIHTCSPPSDAPAAAGEKQ